MTQREYLDRFEEEHGDVKVPFEDVEQALRALVDQREGASGLGEHVVDRLDARRRAEDRGGLFAQLRNFEFAYAKSIVAVDEIPKDQRGTGRKCRGRMYRCSRNASKTASFGGTSVDACFQHVDDAVHKFARENLNTVDDAGERMLDYRESHDPMDRDSDQRIYVDTAEIWRRLADRVTKARSFVESGNWRSAVEEAIETFEAKWGPIDG